MASFSKNQIPSVHIISTGSELSNGHRSDSNGPFIASSLCQSGWLIHGISIVPDNPEVFKDRLKQLLNENAVKLIVITGGLGPTNDDHTLDVLANVCKTEILIDNKAERKVNILIKKRKLEHIRTTLMRQTRTLADADILNNKTGLAPGFIFRYNNSIQTLIAAMPGVPEEMKTMFNNELIPKIVHLNKNARLLTKKYYLYNINESRLQTMLFDEKKGLDQKKLPYDFNWGVTSSNGYLNLYITSQETNSLDSIHFKLLILFKGQIFENDIAIVLHEYCTNNHLRIGLAESCTGGLIGKLLTDLAGSSKWFQGSVVSYSNLSKQKILNVNKQIFSEHGAVSEKCVIEMAQGALQLYEADYCLSTSGIAGPDGGTPDKPVGTVFIGLVSSKGKAIACKQFFPQDRNRIRNYCAWQSLYQLYQFIISEKENNDT